jgi:hypothetical protein
MSDSLALLNIKMTGGDIPRYYDLMTQQAKPEEKPEEIISRFDALRRRKEK